MHKKAPKVPSLLEIDMILDRISHEDDVGHIFIVVIKFHNQNEKTMLLMKYTPPFLKKIKLSKRSIGQFFNLCLLLVIIKRWTLQRHLRKMEKHTQPLKKKNYPSLLIHFLVKREGWLVTKIYQHFTFAQSKFKKDFVVMNQKSRQIAKTSNEKDFYKLLNDSNVGMDCRSNIDNRTLKAIYNGISKITFIKKYDNIFGNDKYFLSSGIDVMTK